MLDIKLNGDILTVVQVTHSCEATHKQYSYMNIKTWHKNGRTLKIDDTILDYKMVDRDIEWCKKYYLPLVELNQTLTLDIACQ